MKLYISTGNSRMEKRWNNVEMELDEFIGRISHTIRTAETVEQYGKMTKAKQDAIKDVGGFVMGKLKGGRRKKDCVEFRSALGEWKDKITIQKSVAGNDRAGNHVLEWQDYYTCHAYVNNLSGKEYWEAAQLNAEKEVFFLIRYCSDAAAIDTEHFRIIFREQIYNITFIDNVKYQNRTLKLRAALEKR